MILYLHGFASSGQSLKGQVLRAELAPAEVLTPTYPSHDPDRAVRALGDLIRGRAVPRSPTVPQVVIGSSLGGFYGQYLATRFDCKLVLINPATLAALTLEPLLGDNVNPCTGASFRLERRHLEALRHYRVDLPCALAIPTLLLLDRGDEVIDPSFALEAYRDCATIRAYPGGDHAFQHLAQSLPLIREFCGLRPR